MRLRLRWIARGAILLGLLAHTPARAEDYPSRPVTIVVSLAAGSGMDTITRLYADKLAEAFFLASVLDPPQEGKAVCPGRGLVWHCLHRLVSYDMIYDIEAMCNWDVLRGLVGALAS